MSLEFIKPQLATAVDKPPPRAGWIHEVKHDGYRTQLIIERGKASAYTRNGFDWTECYPVITKAAAKLECRSAVIDGEVIVQNKDGVSDFDALNSVICWHPQSLIFCAFDVLHLNGKDLRDTGDAAAFFQACADHQLEGMISKLASSKYRSGRSKTWLKCKLKARSSSSVPTETARQVPCAPCSLKPISRPSPMRARPSSDYVAMRGMTFATDYSKSPLLARP